MILGVGTDLVQRARIEQSLERWGERFARRILSPQELAIFSKHHQPAAYLAKRFAGKEAASKALGTGIGQVSWQEISVVNDAAGSPIVELSGAALSLFEARGARHIHVSLTDEKAYALAFVVISR